MKFVVYNQEKKFTIGNVVVPENQELNEIMKKVMNEKERSRNDDTQLCNFRITSTRGYLFDADEYHESMNDEIEKEIEEGISWEQETVN